MPSTTRTIVLPPGLEAAAAARTFVIAHAEHLPPALVDDAVVCVSELVSNALLHGLPEITVQVRTDPPGIGVAVTDLGPDLPAVPGGLPAASSIHGRGLVIVAALSQRLGHYPGRRRQDHLVSAAAVAPVTFG